MYFLEFPLELWKDDFGFRDAKASVQTLSVKTVINDHAEGVALVQSFSGHITKDEEQLQHLLTDHRNSFVNAVERTLLGIKERDSFLGDSSIRMIVSCYTISR